MSRRIKKIDKARKIEKSDIGGKLSTIKESNGVSRQFHKRIPSANIPYSMMSTHTNITRLNTSKIGGASKGISSTSGVPQASGKPPSSAFSSGGRREELRNPSLYRKSESKTHSGKVNNRRTSIGKPKTALSDYSGSGLGGKAQSKSKSKSRGHSASSRCQTESEADLYELP